MGWVDKVKNAFDVDVAKRGQSYFSQRAVTKIHGGARQFKAKVAGSDDYEVGCEYRLYSHMLYAQCTCPYVEEYGSPCKHIYAALLEAQSRGLLTDAAQDSKLRLVLKNEPDENDDALLDDDGFGEEPSAPSSARKKPALILQDLMRMLPPGMRILPGTQLPATRRPAQASPKNTWRQLLADVREDAVRAARTGDESWPAHRRIFYVVNVEETIRTRKLALRVMTRDDKGDGKTTKLVTREISYDLFPLLPDPADRRVLALLNGSGKENDWRYGYGGYTGYKAPSLYALTDEMQRWVMPQICAIGRAMFQVRDSDIPSPVVWDGDGAWELVLDIAEPSKDKLRLTGALERQGQRMGMGDTRLATRGGLVFYNDKVAPLDDRGAFAWLPMLADCGHVDIPSSHADEMLASLMEMPSLPRLKLPDAMRFEEVAVVPRPAMRIRAAKPREGTDKLVGEMSFNYEGREISVSHTSRGFFDRDKRRYLLRDKQAEQRAQALARQLGFNSPPQYLRDGFPDHAYVLAPKKLPNAVRKMTKQGWLVEADGKLYRQPGEFKMQVASGVDWFELRSDFDFDGHTVRLPQLLAALKRGEKFVLLDDGSFGILPQEWLEKYSPLASLGEDKDDHLRFKPSQVGLLDALLASMPEARCDEVFVRARDRLKSFAGIEPVAAPDGFVGRLRPYQNEGLGWIHFLREFGFGGCLADDMGLGKTVQVLAMLEARRVDKANRKNKTSLVVAPRSLIFNWKQEATRFTPALRLLDHTGLQRTKATAHFEDYDVVLTTYGTLRRDAAHFREARFDYAILDEAQSIKNAGTESSKAVRLLQADHKLALSGTPIENHIGELWSLFEFLNPGMLGSHRAFDLGTAPNTTAQESRPLLASALRPFILRRTKQQVAADLPEKTEQTLYCDLPDAQRAKYNELRDYYRDSILRRVAEQGIGRSKIQVLEALLRLRQAACHPGLIDKAQLDQPSAKLEALLPQLSEVLSEGHKALVFSQFTSFLAIVRKQLDEQGVVYEYLDGKTRDRQARVERFQNDPACGLFLISLKAGGLGLNLTAADYVFLLDPWWNPAVEAQAVDRAHRIGQTRHVNAYRLIARDTVEEKVLELQQSKKKLADAILSADNSLIRDLKREDLELLLS